MKKICYLLIVSFFFSNLTFSKIVNLNNEISLDVPKTHSFISFKEDSSMESLLYGVGGLFENFDELELDFSLVGPSNLINLFQLIADGAEVENLEIFQPLIKEAEKKEYFDIGDQKVIKWLGKELKKIAKKEKIDFYTYVISTNKKIGEIDDVEFKEFLNLHKNMEKSDLAKAITKAISKTAGVPDSATTIIFQDVEKASWSVGGEMMSEA